MRVTVLSLGVKAFFTPLMTVFMADHAGNISALWFRKMGVDVMTPEQARDLWARGLDAVREYGLSVAPRLVPSWEQVMEIIDVTRWGRAQFWWAADMPTCTCWRRWPHVRLPPRR